MLYEVITVSFGPVFGIGPRREARMALTKKQLSHLEKRLLEERERALKALGLFDEMTKADRESGDSDLAAYTDHMADYVRTLRPDTLLVSVIRITSYNVCYTKLLRTTRPRRVTCAGSASATTGNSASSTCTAPTSASTSSSRRRRSTSPSSSSRVTQAPKRTRLGSSVITSYSIHYTKLYETRPRWLW